MNFKYLSEWIMIDDTYATRTIIGGNPNKTEDRIAFIEKTPRVRIHRDKYCVEQKNSPVCLVTNQDAWLSGPKGSSDYGLDEDSRKWCDDMLVLLGWG